jgi:hypothetical protein
LLNVSESIDHMPMTSAFREDYRFEMVRRPEGEEVALSAAPSFSLSYRRLQWAVVEIDERPAG